ncbi:hypothetical protein, conserved [Plasmodium gonderi]|uniref:Dna2/nam7 helicase family member n=1 Tax=Plasmodium gonderi TaxID=77519 RepID=A0A1Y1JHN3_PLAGO|nr:hypothetical protein, conserved [Plasmodium gonderi]GAW80845.1 hypothetical protein, conserved [Plasmodium gonderi]
MEVKQEKQEMEIKEANRGRGEKFRANVLEKFEELIKLEHMYEIKEIELCYEHLKKEELIEKGILLNDLTIKTARKHNANKNSYIIKLVRKKKQNTNSNDLSDEENIENFRHNLFSKGSIVHFSKKRKNYSLKKDNNVGNKNFIIPDVVNIYICTVHKIKKNQINLLIRCINELCKELNISNTYLLTDKSYFDVCLVGSEISMMRQLNAINLMKTSLDIPSNILKILFLGKKPSQDLFLRKIMAIFRHRLVGKNKHQAAQEEEKRETTTPVENPEKNEKGESELNGLQIEEEKDACYPMEEDLRNEENYYYKCAKEEWGNKNLNDNQKKAVYMCLYSNDIFCIHGPPGTGKTTVLCELIYQFIKRNKKLLVTGPSNVSVDNILSKCVDMNIRNVVRLGLKSKIRKELWNYSYDEKIRSCDSYKLCEDIDKDIEKLKLEIGKLKNKKKHEKISSFDRKSIMNLKYEIRLLNKSRKKKKNIFFNELMNRNNVIFATCSSSSNYELNKFIKYTNFLFDAVCIDECCQCTEPLCYIPISLSKKNIFLFGDHKQLAPLVKYKNGSNKLSVTLFERLIKKYKKKISFLLKIQYRMNDLILRWSNKMFYENRLVSHHSCRDITIGDLFSPSRLDVKRAGGNKGIEAQSERKKVGKDKKKKKQSKKKNDEEMKQVEVCANDSAMIQSYSYCPITWIETDGFDEFLDDTKELDMIHLEMKGKKNYQLGDSQLGDHQLRDRKLAEDPGRDQVLPVQSGEKCEKKSLKIDAAAEQDQKKKNGYSHNDTCCMNQKRSDNESGTIVGMNMTSDDKGHLEGKDSNGKSSNGISSNGISSNGKSPSDEEIDSESGLSSAASESASSEGTKAENKEKNLEDAIKIDVEDIINLNNKSRSNSGEAYVIYKLIERMLHVDRISANHICVITPYSKQMNLLRNIFYDNLYNEKNYRSDYKEIEISTVDSFQGREKEIVILSLVCSNYFKNIGFLKDYRRLNVAITRSKRHVVVVGNSSTISNDTILNQLYETILNYGKVYLVNELIDVENIPLNG